MNAFFRTTPDGQILVMATFSSAGKIGDLRETVEPGESFGGVRYDDLKAAGAGRLALDAKRGTAQIVGQSGGQPAQEEEA